MGKPAVAITLSAEERRLDGLCDEPRPGAPRQIRDEAIAELVRRTLEETPPGSTHWSLRSMARAVGYAPSTVNRIWQAFGLQPHRSETLKLYTDPFFVEKVRDIVGLYQAPTQRAKREEAGAHVRSAAPLARMMAIQHELFDALSKATAANWRSIPWYRHEAGCPTTVRCR
jgi:hypothetical protein